MILNRERKYMHNCFVNIDALKIDMDNETILDTFIPPPQFIDCRLDNYLPDKNYMSQFKAQKSLLEFVTPLNKQKVFKFLNKNKHGNSGIYLDGGFGVGKTHLLAGSYYAFEGKKIFGTFLEYTSFVGFVGFKNAVDKIKKFDLICIDEFELDDPGDTMIITRLLESIMSADVKVIVTSNTPPLSLGKGRFAADNFLREIRGLANKFNVIQIDGNDYRHRENDSKSRMYTRLEIESISLNNKIVLEINFIDLCNFLKKEHPISFGNICEKFQILIINDVKSIDDQSLALKLVMFIDRAYDNKIRIIASGTSLENMFSEDIVAGGYQKKYQRAISRMIALSYI